MQPTSWSGARRPRKLHARLLRIARVKPEAKPVLFWWTAAEASDLRAIQSTCRFAQWPMTPALSWKSDEPRCQHKTIPVLFRISLQAIPGIRLHFPLVRSEERRVGK